VLMLAMFMGLWTLPPLRPDGEIVKPGLASLVDGWQYLRRSANIRTQYLMAIIAMTFVQPLTLFPALGTVLLGGRAITTGALTASVAAGSFLSSVFSGSASRYRWHGRGIARAIQVYGAAIALFGAVLVVATFVPGADETTPHLGLIIAACLALAVSGGADNISSIYRNTMMQAAVPDAMRGRLQGIFIVVVAGGPRIGALYAGALASLTVLWFPPLLGGMLVIALITLLMRRVPRFREYDALAPAA